MKRRTTTRYSVELVESHRALNASESKHTDGYEGRIPNTPEGIMQARQRASAWLAFAAAARR